MVISAVAAIVLAAVMMFAYICGWYLIFLLPALCAGLLGLVIFAMVAWIRCRNRWVAAALGVLAGLICYFGHYDLCLRYELPPGMEWRIEMLPKYISYRMNTDVQKDVGRPGNAQRDTPVPFLNWFTFILELGAVTGICGGMGWFFAGRAYCHELEKWMKREIAYLPLYADDGFPTALASGKLAEFLAVTPAGANEQNSCKLILEYAEPKEGSLLNYPVYATLSRPLPTHSVGKMLSSKGRTVLRQVQLEPAEVLTLRPLFPELAKLLAAQHEELRNLPSDVSLIPLSEENAPREFAQMFPVPEPYRQRVRAKGYTLWVNLLGLTPVLFIAAGAALLGLGFWLGIGKAMALGFLAIPFGAPLFFWGFYMALYCTSVPENRWIERRLRREVGQRPDFLVDPRDPQSLYATLIPRENFVKIKFTLTSDLFLLKIDEAKRQLLIEGDINRYLIPRGAITICEPQCFFHPIDHEQRTQIWVARLMVQFEEGLREMLLCHNSTKWSPITNKRRYQRSENLCNRIKGVVK